MTKLYLLERKQQVRAVAQPESDGPLFDMTEALGGAFALSQLGLISFIRQGPEAWHRLQRELARGGAPRVEPEALAESTILPPVMWPTKIACVGQNYLDHCLEQNVEPPKTPIIFSKFPQCIVGHGAPIAYPDITTKLDYEVELAVIVGRRMRSVSADEALAGVFGYTVANDITARDIQKLDGQWTRAKGCDTACPLGPCLVTADAVAKPHELGLRSFVDGERRQSSSTNQMIFSIAQLLEWCSRAFTLYPGDVLLTGTPPGVGMYMKPPRLLEPGQRVRVEIDGIGALENPVVAREEWLRIEERRPG